LDSSGIRCLVIACRRTRQRGGEFAVADAEPVMRRARRMGPGESLPVVAAPPA
jgi:anti-anti-sigma regulatory factor